MSRLSVYAGLVPLLILLGGCVLVGPDYVPPEINASQNWQSAYEDIAQKGPVDSQTLASWWTTFNDPLLTRLIDRALADNLDLQSARARLREARARRGFSQASLFPTLDLSGAVTRSRGSGENSKVNESYSAAVDAGWELDLFGGVRRSVEAADAELQASHADLQSVRVSTAAEVALNYVEVRTYQARLNYAEANLANLEDTFALTRDRAEAGLDDQLAVEQSRYNLENARSQLPTLRTGLQQAMNRLAVLSGQHPGALRQSLTARQPIPVASEQVAVGVPAEALRRRPDIRQAERNLAAQTARIGVAEAELYPKFRLSGSIGLEALSAGSLFNLDSRTYSYGPRVSWPIFDAGAIRNNIAVQSALQEQALARYQSTILGALEEVENALTSYAENQLRRQALQQAARAAKNAADIAQIKYAAGLINFSEVLDAQRSRLSFDDSLARSDGDVTISLVTLYKALGGGWTSMAEEQEQTKLSQQDFSK